MQTTECPRQACHAGSDSYRVILHLFTLKFLYLSSHLHCNCHPCCVSEGVPWTLTCTFWIPLNIMKIHAPIHRFTTHLFIFCQ
jgi:hypothetical protein